MVLRAEAYEYTARFEGRLSSGAGGPGYIARLKVSDYSQFCSKFAMAS